MDLFILIAIIVANVVAILLTYFFIKSLEKKDKIIFIAISVAINYVVVSAIFLLSSIGIDEKVVQLAKNFVTYLFVPVNMIVLMPLVANTYCKLKQKDIKSEQLKKRIIIFTVLALILIVFEVFYFRNLQVNITNYSFLK